MNTTPLTRFNVAMNEFVSLQQKYFQFVLENDTKKVRDLEWLVWKCNMLWARERLELSKKQLIGTV